MFSTLVCLKHARRLTLDVKSVAFVFHGGDVLYGLFHGGDVTSGFPSHDSRMTSTKLVRKHSQAASIETAPMRVKAVSDFEIDPDVALTPKFEPYKGREKLGRVAEFDSFGESNDEPKGRKRTFKSVYELPPPEPCVTRTSALREFWNEFKELFPEVKNEFMWRHKHEAGFKVIMEVSIKDLFWNMPYRTTFCILAPFTCFFVGKLAIIYLSFKKTQAIVVGSCLFYFILNKYLSAVCTIKHNPTTSTYAADFPFRIWQPHFKFRKNHVRSVSTESNFFTSCHVIIKGKKVFCPRSCFTTTHHYEEWLKTNALKRKL